MKGNGCAVFSLEEFRQNLDTTARDEVKNLRAELDRMGRENTALTVRVRKFADENVELRGALTDERAKNNALQNRVDVAKRVLNGECPARIDEWGDLALIYAHMLMGEL